MDEIREERRERYINPYTDFGFKKLFGTVMNKDLLISFLNALFHGHEEIRDVTYLPTEQMAAFGERRAIFDVYCENADGEKFIVEMQKTEQDYFKDRSVFYASFPIQQQGRLGSDWDFCLKGVYSVGILNFVFPDHEYSDECFHHEVKLMDVDDKHVFFDKLTFIYLEMPKFNKKEEELVTMFDKWLFVLRNLSRLLDRPAALQEKIFVKLFEQAEIARFDSKEVREYEDSVKIYRDLQNSMRTAHRKGKEEGVAEGMAKGKEEGLAEGMAKGMAKGMAEGMAKGMAKGMAEGLAKGKEEGMQENRLSTARKMKALGSATDFISQVTGLTEEEIDIL